MLKHTLGGVKHSIALTSPTPHAIRLAVLILACRVTTEEHHRLALLAILVTTLRHNLVIQARLQPIQLRIGGNQNALSSTSSIHHRTKSRSVYLVQIEMIICFPSPVLFQLCSRNVIQVNHWHIHLLSQSEEGWCEIQQLTLNPLWVILLIVIARSEREENRSSTLSTNLIDETPCVTTKCINHFLLLSHLIIDRDRVIPHLQSPFWTITGASPNRINRTIIIMSQFQQHIITLLHCLQH